MFGVLDHANCLTAINSIGNNSVLVAWAWIFYGELSLGALFEEELFDGALNLSSVTRIRNNGYSPINQPINHLFKQDAECWGIH
jgi:hypothetical protein